VRWADIVGRIAGLRTAGLLRLLDALVRVRYFFIGNSSLWVRWSFKMVSSFVLFLFSGLRVGGAFQSTVAAVAGARTGDISASCVLL
jgi:hypothetical protein